MNLDKMIDRLLAKPGRKISLDDYDPQWTGKIKDKKAALKLLREGVEKLADQQDKLYAQDTWALLVVFQAMDAAGKDGTIKHVMSGVNPQGCHVVSFKGPSMEERDHDYLWRSVKALPARGTIGIHNRSHYEEVLIVRVHKKLLLAEQLSPDRKTKHVWQQRFDQINAFERYLDENCIKVVKFYLNVSKEEQKRRFLERIDTAEKNWKFQLTDVAERGHWDDYRRAYEDVFTHTSTKWAPRYIVPADNKWFMRAMVAAIINRTLEKLKLEYPTIDESRKQELSSARQMLMAEKV